MRVAAAAINPVDVKTRSGVVPRAIVRMPRVCEGALRPSPPLSTPLSRRPLPLPLPPLLHNRYVASCCFLCPGLTPLSPITTTHHQQILGSDVAGVVEEADSGSAFKKGDRVFACTGQHLFTSE